MKQITFFIFLTLGCVLTGQAQYCTPSGSGGNGAFLGEICFPTTANPFTNCNQTNAGGNYGDFTGLGSRGTFSPTPSAPGTNQVLIGLDRSNAGDYAYAVYVDLNQDMDFDDSGEQLASGTGNISFATGGRAGINTAITIPMTATNGVTRMRIIAQDGSAPVAGPCITGFNGEPEDYLITISGAGGSSNTPPNAVCTNYTAQLNTAGNVTITGANVDGGSNDAEGAVTLSVSPSSFNCSNIGANTVTLTVTDAGGLTDTCTATVTVEDNVNPVITCAANGSRNTDTGSNTYTVQATEFDATFTDNCNSGSVTNNFNNMVSLVGAELPVGTTTVNWTANDGNGQTAMCSVAITVLGNINISGGNLVYNDTNGVDDDITISIDGANYRISDANGGLSAGMGAIQDGNDVLVPVASVSGNIQMNTQNGNDSVTVDLSGGNFGVDVLYNGGSQTGTPGDVLALTGGGTFASVAHTFVNANDGAVVISGNNQIVYTGLEPVTDNLSASDRVFTFTGGAETIRLNTSGGLDNRIDSTLGELVDFTNPTTSLTINAGTGDDTVFVEGLDAAFDANLTINGDDSTDVVRFRINPTSLGNGNLVVNAERTDFDANVTTLTTGSITINSDIRTRVVNGAIITTVDGDINLNGNAGGSPTNTFNSDGIFLNGAAVLRTTGTGNINLEGVGTSNGGGNFHIGVLVRASSIIENTGTGSVNIIGTGGNGANSNQGIRFENAGTTVRSINGNITLNGTSGSGTGTNNEGVAVLSNSLLEITGTGMLDITGNSLSGTNSNKAIVFNNADALTVGGGITMQGTASGSGNNNDGVAIENNASLEDTAAGNIMLTGTGASGVNTNLGIDIGGTSIVRTNNGAINFIGNGGVGTGNNNRGMRVSQNSQVTATGSGAITLVGTAGTGINGNFGIEGNNAIIRANTGAVNFTGNAGGTGASNFGIVFGNSNGIIESNGGGIILTGTGANATANFNQGVVISNASTVQELSTGSIMITGTGGDGDALNRGVEMLNSSITSNGGDIMINGTGGNGSGNLNIGVSLRNNPIVTTIGTGNIVINGTGGVGNNANYGNEIVGNAIVSSESGAITLTGIAADAVGGSQNGLQINGTFSSSQNAPITLNGTSGTANSVAVNIAGLSTLVQTGGDVTINANNSERIITAVGIPANDLIEANIITINGVLRPGNGNRAQFPVSGNTLFASDDTLQFNIAGFTTAGTDFDQLVITGTVDVSGATLTLIDNFGPAEDACETITLIDNDGADAIIGTFVGIAEGDSVTFGGITGKVSYVGGDGNDFTLKLDDTSPTAVCQDITIQLDANGDATIVAADVDGGSTDNCGIASLAVDIDTFDCSNVGPNNVILTVTDVNGNSSTCTAVVTVEDNVTPTAVCMDITVQLDATGNASITAGDVDGGSTDNCGIASLAVDIDTFSCADVGPNTVTLTVTDVNGNSSTCTAVVTVEDNVAPTAVCQDITIQLDANGDASIVPADIDGGSTDACGIASISASQTDFTCADVGQNNVTLTVTDVNGNSSSCVAVVTVEDTIFPMLTCPADIVAGTNNGTCGGTVTFVTPVASDNCGIDFIIQQAGLPSGSVFPVGVTTNQFAVVDVNGNVTTCSFTVTVEDVSAPLAVCQDITVMLDTGGTATIVPADVDGGSSDNCAIDTLSIDIDTFTCADLGPNTVTLTVTDTSGNSDTCTAIVTVENGVMPNAVCQDASVALDALGMVTITDASIFDGGSTDACGGTNLTFSVSPDTFGCSDVGDNTVTLTVTDDGGNTSTCTATLTVEDVIDPTVSCMDLTVSLDKNGEASINAADLVILSDDICGIDTTTADITDFSCDDVGAPVTVTVTVTDPSGNSATCTATVTVLDELPPVLDCPTAVTVQTTTGTQFEVEDFITSGVVSATDNCTDPVIVVSQSPAVGDLLDPGVYPATITVEDASGNQADCAFELTVEEVLGANSFDISSVTMYPNPASDFVMLSNPQNIPLQDVSIYDVTGRLIKTLDASQVVSEIRIDISELASATYVVLISAENAQMTKQLVKE